jgi:hypothetical protein
MRIKCDNSGGDFHQPSALDDSAHDLLMGEVKAIEHAKSNHGWRFNVAVVYVLKDFHRAC